MDFVTSAHDEWLRNGWDGAADGLAAVLSLVHANRVLTDRVDRALRPFDLTFARYEVLRLLAFGRKGGMRIGRLGELLQVHSTSVTSVVGRLESSGLVWRARDVSDRRRVVARITPAGRERVEEATSALNVEVFGQLLPLQEFQRLWGILRSFRANAGDFAAGSRAHI